MDTDEYGTISLALASEKLGQFIILNYIIPHLQAKLKKV